MCEEREESTAKKLPDFLNPASPKVLALYQAISELLQEGKDVSLLKVADIASRAGIGKGTVYEYFKSREELIVKAICYDVYIHFAGIMKEVQLTEGFEQKIKTFLRLLFGEEKSDGKGFITERAMFLTDMEKLPQPFQEELRKCREDLRPVSDIFDWFYKRAVEEGIVEDGLHPYYVNTAFFNLIMDYAVLAKPCPKQPEFDIPLAEEVKKRLYENLLYSLRL